MNAKSIRVLFVIAGIYDGMLGIAFAVIPEKIFAFYVVTPPNHMAYVEFPAFLLLIFAVMFFRIASDPFRFRELIFYGCGLKLSYCWLVFKYQSIGTIPTMWVPWAWLDLAFLVAFLFSWYRLGRLSPPS